MSAHKITTELLKHRNACGTYKALFNRLYPDGSIEVTWKNAQKVVDRFDWDWAAEYLLPPEGITAFYRRREGIRDRDYAREQEIDNRRYDPIDTESITRAEWGELFAQSQLLRRLETAQLFVTVVSEYGLIEMTEETRLPKWTIDDWEDE